jgi:molybdopterin converting factor small subunit
MYYLIHDVSQFTKISENHCSSAAMSPSQRRARLTSALQIYTKTVMSPTAPPNHFTILYFATASAFAGTDGEALPAGLRLGDLHARLEERHPGFGRILEGCLVTHNLDYVDVVEQADRVVEAGDEVAIISPVSSG